MYKKVYYTCKLLFGLIKPIGFLTFSWRRVVESYSTKSHNSPIRYDLLKVPNGVSATQWLYYVTSPYGLLTSSSISELAQQDGRGKNAANFVRQA